MIWIIAHFLAVCVGISLGLIGGGGSILAVPILVYVLGVPLKSAIAMSLVTVGAVSLIGIIPHWLQNHVNFQTAALFSPSAMLGAYIGARLASLPIVTPTLQHILFVIVMFVASYFMIQNSHHKSAANVKLDVRQPSAELELSPNTYKNIHRWVTIPAEGLGVGIITGMVGIGGGFMIIPTLVLLGNTPIKEAIGTSLVIMTFKSVTGFAGYFGHVPIDVNLMLSFTLAAGLGMLLGAYLTRFVEAQQLETGFGYFVIAIAIFMLLKW
ncbi:putative permease [Nostoc sp. PCC 7524]|uniref:sulfite exporter TauE/SafE family protein n=1 Tax=Nostoc sp. (strain ATCC 29411 / PCC 7524) TaxID=28072 RepID=UPI00029ED622|nr:sulfite exporter TauE/SafE family protein [Nostoc sp. PCC 7524]AFY46148.1 putative permease [Nostoc sp. PCC 7524]